MNKRDIALHKEALRKYYYNDYLSNHTQEEIDKEVIELKDLMINALPLLDKNPIK